MFALYCSRNNCAFSFSVATCGVAGSMGLTERILSAVNKLMVCMPSITAMLHVY